LARDLNEYFGNATTDTSHDSRLGFFGVLPDWRDVEGTLSELDYLYETQKLCNGVTVYTTYGDRLLGDSQFAPIWARLQKYKALVFLHPGVLAVEPRFVATSLPQPIIDYPIATTRAAVDLVMTQTLRGCPDVDVILSHAGGTLPFLAERAIGSLAVPEIAEGLGYDMGLARQDFARFYYDTALSTSNAQLHGLLDFVDSSHILFGSDFPYAPQFAINALLARYAAFVATDQRGQEVSPAKLRENALKLLNKHALGKTI
jgi:predicted TIM-barrel fold metal-dependent hydrolase